MREISQSDKITYAILRLDRSFDWWTPTDVRDVLNDEFGESSPSRRTVDNRIHGLVAVGVLEELNNSAQTHTRYRVADSISK